jgi:hypothetical protein
MAIVQISQIKHRRGTNENLPQLGSAELGWSVDTQQLYIGNGTLAEGAPEIGNTEILTELSAARGQIPGLPSSYTQTITSNTTANIASAAFDSSYPGVTINYVVQRGSNVRNGFIRISQYLTNLAYDEEYTETADIAVTLAVTQVGNTYAQLSATAANTGIAAGIDANIKYSFANLSFS